MELRRFTSGFLPSSRPKRLCLLMFQNRYIFLIIESIRKNFSLEKAGRQQTIFTESYKWWDLEEGSPSQSWVRPVGSEEIDRWSCVVLGPSLVVRTAWSTKAPSEATAELWDGMLAFTDSYLPRHGDGDGSGSTGGGYYTSLTSFQSHPCICCSGPLGLCWMGHASLEALILCLFVKGQNVRLPNKI